MAPYLQALKQTLNLRAHLIKASLKP